MIVAQKLGNKSTTTNINIIDMVDGIFIDVLKWILGPLLLIVFVLKIYRAYLFIKRSRKNEKEEITFDFEDQHLSSTTPSGSNTVQNTEEK